IPQPIQTPFTPSVSGVPVKQTPLAETFGKYLKDAVSNYNDVQNQADSMVQHLAVGDKVDIHDVALAVQKATITNQLAIQVRNRLVDAYQEVMRMSM
ncbi:MAG TPA: flagellar hook-basal body complex protein FliE, partial [Chloroflexota bacterium]|nr:flagellar hook-basal body complex protein FliE [Chloroflexota bacterium]